MYSRHAFAKFFDNAFFCDFILISQQNTGVAHLWQRLLKLTNQGGYMKHSKNILTFVFAIVLLIGSAAVAAEAQRRGGSRVVVRQVVRPVVVTRPYYYGYGRYWNRWYNPYYDSLYFYDPYLEAQRQRYYLQNELNGNRRELQKHLEKYRADVVITSK
jgi:hypothetical protein